MYGGVGGLRLVCFLYLGPNLFRSSKLGPCALRRTTLAVRGSYLEAVLSCDR